MKTQCKKKKKHNVKKKKKERNGFTFISKAAAPVGVFFSNTDFQVKLTSSFE